MKSTHLYIVSVGFFEDLEALCSNESNQKDLLYVLSKVLQAFLMGPDYLEIFDHQNVVQMLALCMRSGYQDVVKDMLTCLEVFVERNQGNG